MENNEYELTYYEYSIDWSYDYKTKINIDDYSYFDIQTRCDGDSNSWHIVGVKCGDYVSGKGGYSAIMTSRTEWGHWVAFADVIEFVKWARDKCRFSHYAPMKGNDYFIKRLTRLLKEVEKENTIKQ